MRYLFFFLVVFSTPTLHAQLIGKVVYIVDGDTFDLLTAEKKKVRIRLHGIDCPEKTQDFGQKATQYLAGLISEKTVSVEEMDIDRHERIIGMVTVDSTNVNEALLKSGLAWHYKYYDKNPAWAKLEQAAREAKVGLWSQPNSVPPWDFRYAKKAVRQ
jgi:endonuclease YncB( thermonuclease family)